MKYLKYLIITVVALLSVLRFFRPGYPSMQDDNQIFRLEQLDQCLKDGQIPCRYIANGGLGYGYPLYNFYSPLAYYVAEFFHLLGFSYINAIKISFIIPAFLRTFGMYLLASSFFGVSGGLISSALFSFSPYLAVDTFVRGALSETWALSLLPFVFWAIYKKHHKLSILFLSLLLLSHNLTLIYTLPLLLIFSFYTKNLKSLVRCLFWSSLICSFYLLPAFFENKLTTVNTMTQGYFSYINHFTTLKELFFSNFWGYSASMWGPIDGFSFNIGFVQFLFATLVFIFLKKNHPQRSLITFIYLITIFLLFLTHNKSTFIWRSLSFMPYFQFPWRFLGPSVFILSFAGGAVFQIFKRKNLLLLLTLLITIVLSNLPYYREDIWYKKLTDQEKLSTSEYIRQSGAGLKDYWPSYGKNFPISYTSNLPIVLDGKVDFLNFNKKSNSASSVFYVVTDNATINFPIVYFPDWQVKVNSKITDYQIETELGLIQLTLPKGQYQIEFKLLNTALRNWVNIISLISLIAFIILIIREKRQ